MIDFAQSNLVAVIAGAVAASVILCAAGWQAGAQGDLDLRSLADGVASGIRASGCSAAHPLARINLTVALLPRAPDVTSVALFADHVRAATRDGASASSVEFPALLLDAQLELLGASVLEIAFDPLGERCGARIV